jgi:signal peptidase I
MTTPTPEGTRTSLRERAERARTRAHRVAHSRPVRVLVWAVVLVIGVPGLLYAVPALAGSDAAFIVLTGSMEPGISPGDVVFVTALDPVDVREGDVITFHSRAGDNFIITHRVVEVLESEDRVRWITQGDANQNPDPFVVTPETLIGRVEFKIPAWGLLLNVVKSPLGYVTVVLVPCGLVITRELVRLYKELDAWDRARQSARGDAEE